MTFRNWLAMVCIGVPTVVELGLGVVYFTAREIMPYHEEVLGVRWSELAPGVRTLLVALVNAYGSAHFAAGIALAALLLGPLHRGQLWARWAILGVGLPVLGGTAYVSTRIAFTTGVDMPWKGAAVLLVLFIIGVALAAPNGASHASLREDAA